MSRVGILGGTFDPPHNGHIALARAALVELKLDKVIFVPSLIPPHKIKKSIASSEDRMNMLRLAIEGIATFEVSDIELRREGPSFTVDTLTQLRNINPDTEIFLLIGCDNVSEISTWREPDRIAELATIAAANRPGFEPNGQFKDKVLFFDMRPTDISSTAIRDRRKAGESISEMVPAKVQDYIERQGLYR